MAQDISKKRREALRRFFSRREAETGRSRTAICEGAGVREGTVRNFINGTGPRAPKSMTVETYDKLAAAEGVSVCELLGEATLAKGDMPIIDHEVMTSAFLGWNIIVEKMTGEPRTPAIEPHREAEIISRIYSDMAVRSQVDRMSRLEQLASDLGYMVSLTEIIPASGGKTHAPRRRDDKAAGARKSSAAAGEDNG